MTLEYGEVSNVRRLQAAHALFTALEYTNDPIEIMNDQFKLLVIIYKFFVSRDRWPKIMLYYPKITAIFCHYYLI